ncbi:MAG: isoprenylcysteine carboxylmethyltransferase family protein [Solirubrobacteraceae bacterium]
MPGVALALFLLYLAVAFGWRTWRQIRLTGSTGFHGISGTPATAEWWGGALFVVALGGGLAAPALQLAGTLEPVSVLDHDVVTASGAVLAAVGIALTVLAQVAMGTAWRIGVNDTDRTALVTGGLFGLVRNPVFTAMIMTAAGLALLAPNAIAVLAVAVLVIAIELQVRVTEEPYLARVHGDAYGDYVARVGRLVPLAGRARR